MTRHALPLLLLGILACAASEGGAPGRGAPSPSNGWIELAIVDPYVPADPAGTARPPPCHVELEIDGAAAFSKSLDPQGSSPPYKVEETIRVPATPGPHAASLYYSSCRTAWGQLDGRDVAVAIDVQPGHVTRLEFDGSTVLTWPPAPL